MSCDPKDAPPGPFKTLVEYDNGITKATVGVQPEADPLDEILNGEPIQLEQPVPEEEKPLWEQYPKINPSRYNRPLQILPSQPPSTKHKDKQAKQKAKRASAQAIVKSQRQARQAARKTTGDR